MQDHLSTTFAALADPTRRAILAQLALGETSVTELAEPFDMSLPAVTKHLKVLENAGLITRSREAQWRPCQLKAAPLKEAAQWMEHYRQFWEASLDRLDDYLKNIQTMEKKHARRKNNLAPAQSGRELIMTRTFDAPRELVWEAMTNPEHIVHWWGPRGFSTTIQVMDVRVGGKWEHVMHGPDGTDYPNHSVFTEITKPERISFSHGGGKPGSPSVEFEATWTFEALTKDKTKVTICMVFPTAEKRDAVVKEYGAMEGGNQTLERLEAFTAKTPLVIERMFDAPSDTVWKALTDPDQMRKWYFENISDFKAEVGFKTSVIVHHDGKDYNHLWEVTKVVPGRVIAYSWKYKGMYGDSMLTFTLLPEGKKTRLILTHENIHSFAPATPKINFFKGWLWFMDKALKEFLGKVQ